MRWRSWSPSLKGFGRSTSGEFWASPIEYLILTLRGKSVMLDADLAAVYGVSVKSLRQSVKRNIDRFPADFMFQLSDAEWSSLRSQFVTSNDTAALRSQIAASKSRGGRRYAPRAFTQEGVAMLSGVLNSPRAIEAHIEIVPAFVRLRTNALSYAELSRRIDGLEAKYDENFAVVFEALRALMNEPTAEERKMGFRIRERRSAHVSG
jgi:hypothetical protein